MGFIPNSWVEFHLKILGLAGAPTKAQIAKAYRREIKKWHPDKHQQDVRRKQAEEAAKQINAAYAFLKNHRFSKTAPPPSAAAQPPSGAQFVNRIIPVDSARINSVRFDERTRSFSLLFRDGHISRFTKVPRDIFDRFLASRAKDAFVAANVFNKFTEEKIA